MADAIEKVNGATLAAWTPEQRDLIKRTVAKDATDDELAMFLHIAQRAQLDPLRKQIHFMKYQGRVTVVADVNGLQARAAREADFEGLLHAVVYQKDDFAVDNTTGRVIRHTSNPLGDNGAIIGAWATVLRRGMQPFTAVVRFAEYRNKVNPLWETKPAVMIDKCAKSTALRLAYPEQLGSIYDEAELGREEDAPPPPPAAPVTPPKTRAAANAELQKVLAAQTQVVDGAVTKTEPAPAGPKEDVLLDGAKAKAAWEAAKKLGDEHGLTPEKTWDILHTRFGVSLRARLCAADVERLRDYLEDVPPPPSDKDAPPVEDNIPF